MYVLGKHKKKRIKLEHEALDYAYTAPRWSATRGQRCNGEFFRVAYSTPKISYVRTIYRCYTAKSSPLLDSSCRDSHKNGFSNLACSAEKFFRQEGVVFVLPLVVPLSKLSHKNLVIQQYFQLCCYAASDVFVAALHLEILLIATVPPFEY